MVLSGDEGFIDISEFAPCDVAGPLDVRPGDLADIPDLIHPDTPGDGNTTSETPVRHAGSVAGRRAAKRARKEVDRAHRQIRATMAAEEAREFSHQRQERHGMRLAETATRAPDAGRAKADARAAGQARADARRKDQRQAKRDAMARADADLAHREAGVTEEERRKGRDKRPERKRMEAEAKRQRQAAAWSE